MPKKNDLSAIRTAPKNVLSSVPTVEPQAVLEPVQETRVGNERGRGRPKKPQGEKATNPVTIKLTDTQYKNLQDKAGLVPLASYLKDHLENETDILD